MALTAQELAQVNSISQTTTNIETLVQTLVSIFNAGGVANPDLATLKAELQAYADSKVAGQMPGNAATATLASDVDLGGGLTAKGQGFFNKSVIIEGTTDNVDTIVNEGVYRVVRPRFATNWPVNGDGYGTLHVFKDNTNTLRTIQVCDFSSLGVIAERFSENPSNGWGVWHYTYNISPASNNIYISKDGNDYNIGFESTKPVATLSAAVELARTIRTRNHIVFNIGPGDWGNWEINADIFNTPQITIKNFVTSTSIEEQNNVPYFNYIHLGGGRFGISNISVKELRADNAWCHLTYGLYLGKMMLSDSYAVGNANLTIKLLPEEENYLFYLVSGSNLYFGDITFDIDQNIKRTYFISGFHSSAYFYNNTFSNSIIGKKYSFSGDFAVDGLDPEQFPGTEAGTGNYTYNFVPHLWIPSGDNTTPLGNPNNRFS